MRLTRHHPTTAAAALPVAVALLLLGPVTASASTPVAPPLSSAAPGSSLPTVGGPMSSSSNFHVSHPITDWFAISCQPSASRPVWSITSTDPSLPPHEGVLPTNVSYTSPSLGWPVAVLGASSGAVVYDSGCFADAGGAGSAASTGLVSNSTGNEITQIGAADTLAGLPQPQAGAWLPVLPGASTSASPASSMSVIDAPAPSTSNPSNTSAPAVGTSVPTAPTASPPTHHRSSGVFLFLLVLSFVLSGFGLARARARANDAYDAPGSSHPALLAHAVLGEVAAVIGGGLALVSGAVGASLLDGIGCLLAGMLAAFAFEARLHATNSPDRLGVVDLIHAAREKPLIPAVVAAIGVVAVATGTVVGVALALLGILLVGVLSVPGRMRLARARAARDELAGSLSAVLGVNVDALLVSPDWGVDDAGALWVSPLPPQAHARLLGVQRHEAAALIARSLPAWEIARLDDRGIWLCPATVETQAKREHLIRSGGLFEGEVPAETRPGPAAERHDPPTSTTPASATSGDDEPTDWFEGW